MIISASRRTDIPAAYMEWFTNRLKEGLVLVRNPMQKNMVSKISLQKEDVDAIVFWTKFPAQFLLHEPALRDYPFYMHYTLNGYDKEIEPGLPNLAKNIDLFKSIADRIGRDRLIWRYSPVLVNAENTLQTHFSRFREIAQQLNGATFRVMISFIDVYDKIKVSMQKLGIKELLPEQKTALLTGFKKIAQENHIELQLCSEAMPASNLEIASGSCIDKTLIEKLCGYRINTSKDKGQRPECLCAQSVDIGAYNTCPLGCAYCYANVQAQSALKNAENHDAQSPLLFGALQEGDTVREKEAKKAVRQGMLFK